MLFSSSAQRWEILKKHVELFIKSQSDTRWESRIKCIKPLRYNLKEVLLALKDLEAISIERKDGRAASETKSLIAHLSKWSFLLSVFIWYDILFQVNKASKITEPPQTLHLSKSMQSPYCWRPERDNEQQTTDAAFNLLLLLQTKF